MVIRLERNYRSTGHILAAASHIIAHNEGRLGKTLRTDDVLGEKVTVTGSWDSEEEARTIGEEIEQLQRGGQSGEPHALNEIAILVRASFQMREFEDRFVTLGLPYRVIGGPRFYERAEIRDALAYLRVVNSPADDLAFERIVNVPKRGLGDATVQLLHDHARKRRVPLTEAARAMVETDELKPKPRGSLRGVLELVRPLAQAARCAAAQRARRNHPRRIRLHRDVAEGPLRRCRRPAGEPERAGALHGGVREPARLSRTHLAGDGQRQERRRRRGQHHDPALGQGPRIQHRVPARLGGRPVPAPAHARRPGPRRPRRRAPPRPCRADARAQAGEDLFRHQPAHARPVADQHPVALPRRIAGSQCRGDRGAGRLRRLWRLRRLALRRHHLVRLELQHARLAARAGEKSAAALPRAARVTARTKTATASTTAPSRRRGGRATKPAAPPAACR